MKNLYNPIAAICKINHRISERLPQNHIGRIEAQGNEEITEKEACSAGKSLRQTNHLYALYK